MTRGVDTLVQSVPMEYSFFVPGRPKSKDRPRLGRRRKVFTPEATLLAEAAIAEAYDGPFFEGPVYVNVTYSFKGQTITIESAPEEPTTIWQSDVDNLLKTTLDGLQSPGGAFANDSQVRRVLAHKIK